MSKLGPASEVLLSIIGEHPGLGKHELYAEALERIEPAPPEDVLVWYDRHQSRASISASLGALLRLGRVVRLIVKRRLRHHLALPERFNYRDPMTRKVAADRAEELGRTLLAIHLRAATRGR